MIRAPRRASGDATCAGAPSGSTVKSPEKEDDLASQTVRRQGSRSVAAADLVIPRPPKPLVDRPRLFERLDDGVAGPLTLISAPAGAGKTSLLASWLAGNPREVAWLTPRPQLTEAAFWAEWLPPRHPVAPARSCLPRPAPPPPRPPPLPLHLLRASGELTELRALDLAMTPGEAQELLDGLGLEVEPHVLSLLLEQTEGWAAGIRLFTLAHRGRGPGVTMLEAIELDERPASEYLLAEVLRRQSDETRDFLLATSVAERFTADLANAMTGRSDSGHLAERLVADNLFIERLDTQPPWYRYHHLFAELLRAELRHTARDRIGLLHGRAARWHFENRGPMEAVHHALAAGDLELLTLCLVEGWFELVARTDAAFRSELLGLIAESDVDASAALSAVLASIEFINGNTRSASRRLDRSRNLWTSS